MFFTSWQFPFFFFIVFILYWTIFNKSAHYQNLLILFSSYYFYSLLDWRYGIILFLSTLIAYGSGILIDRNEGRKKKWFFYLPILYNILILVYFKYANFFLAPAIKLFNHGHIPYDLSVIKIILPIGLSFFTFQSLGYIIDVYNEKYKPVTDAVSFFAFISFFPIILSGPIERGNNLLKQLQTKRTFNYEQAKNGAILILVGLMKKVIIANTLSDFVRQCFRPDTNGYNKLVGIIFYTFQLYADFSGYSDIAIGLGKLLGVEILSNFRFPFFSRSIPEYWSRWHISLSDWLNDYIFTPLVLYFRYYGKLGLILSILVTFLISGMWHGAAITFVLWGALHGLYYVPTLIRGRSNSMKYTANDNFRSVKTYFQILLTFFLVCMALVLFRSNTINEAIGLYKQIFNLKSYNFKHLHANGLLVAMLLVLFEFAEKSNERIYFQYLNNRYLKGSVFAVLTLATTYFYLSNIGAEKFLYFNF